MLKTKEELKTQAEKIGLRRWIIHNCSMCGYPCGYIINGGDVKYDCGCDCVGYTDIQQRNWDDLAENYNRNQPEKNSQISQEYLTKLNEIWKF